MYIWLPLLKVLSEHFKLLLSFMHHQRGPEALYQYVDVNMQGSNNLLMEYYERVFQIKLGLWDMQLFQRTPALPLIAMCVSLMGIITTWTGTRTRYLNRKVSFRIVFTQEFSRIKTPCSVSLRLL